MNRNIHGGTRKQKKTKLKTWFALPKWEWQKSRARKAEEEGKKLRNLGRDKLKTDNFNSTKRKTKIAKGQEGKKARQREQRTHFRRPGLKWRGQRAQQCKYVIKKKSEQYLHVFWQKQSGDWPKAGRIYGKKTQLGLELTGPRVINKKQRCITTAIGAPWGKIFKTNYFRKWRCRDPGNGLPPSQCKQISIFKDFKWEEPIARG